MNKLLTKILIILIILLIGLVYFNLPSQNSKNYSNGNLLSSQQTYEVKTEILDWNYKFLDNWIGGMTLIFVILAFVGWESIKGIRGEVTEKITAKGEAISLQNERIINEKVSSTMGKALEELETKITRLEEQTGKALEELETKITRLEEQTEDLKMKKGAKSIKK